MISGLQNRFASLTAQQKRMLAAGMAALMVLCLGSGFLVSRAAAVAQEKVMAQVNASLNGRLAVGSLDISLLGTINANQVMLYDQHQELIGRADRISVGFSLPDLLAGRTDLGALRSVALDRPFVIIRQRDGIWNWADILKPQNQTADFHGRVEVRQGVVAMEAPDNRILEAVDGRLDFAAYPAFSLDLTGKRGAIPLSAKGDWRFGGDGAVAIKAEKAPLADLPLALLGLADAELTAGTVDSLAVKVTRQGGVLSYGGEGVVAGLAAKASGYDITKGAGQVKLEGQAMTIQNAAFLLNGQPLTLAGTVTVGDNTALHLNVAANNFDAAVLAGSAFRGAITFQAVVQGTPSRPTAQGQFSIPEGGFGSLTFTAASGSFAYADSLLMLESSRAVMWDGSVLMSGTVRPTSQRYDLAVNGRGVDSALLSNQDIRGRADFDSAVSGQGTSSIVANGSFRMGEGSYHGLPFLAMTGDFTKHGEQVSFSNVVVTTVTGSFAATGFTEGSIVRFQKNDLLPNNPVNSARESLNRTVTDQLKKLRP